MIKHGRFPSKKELLDEEEELQFAGFNEITAWELGEQMVEYAMSEKIYR